MRIWLVYNKEGKFIGTMEYTHITMIDNNGNTRLLGPKEIKEMKTAEYTSLLGHVRNLEM